MKIGIPKETANGERRVALVPDTVSTLVSSGMEVMVESGAGLEANFSDDMYREAGAVLLPDAVSLFGSAEVILKVQGPSINDAQNKHEVDLMADGATLISFLQPLTNLDLVKKLKAKGITSFSMDTVPRIARAQSMDALSSMSSIAGYKAAIMAANSLAKYFPRNLQKRLNEKRGNFYTDTPKKLTS
jgi:NAD(P) transhydrogenase subunit alpha